MTIEGMQETVDKWVTKEQHAVKYFPPFEMMAQLTEELGEIAKEIAHLHGVKKKKDTEQTEGLEAEIGDLLFGVICLANSHGIYLEKAFEKTMEKKNGRDAARFIHKQ